MRYCRRDTSTRNDGKGSQWSRTRVDEFTENVREREDSAVLYEDQHPYAGGYYALYCENPDRMKVELVGPE